MKYKKFKERYLWQSGYWIFDTKNNCGNDEKYNEIRNNCAY